MKNNEFGTKKGMTVFALYDAKCANCSEVLTVKTYQLGHIDARVFAYQNGEKANHRISNVVCLCKSCNSAMATNGLEWLPEKVQTFVAKVRAWETKASNQNDLRSLLKNPIRNINGKLITMAVMTKICDNYAMANPTSKFARLHRNGMFHQKAIA